MKIKEILVSSIRRYRIRIQIQIFAATGHHRPDLRDKTILTKVDYVTEKYWHQSSAIYIIYVLHAMINDITSMEDR